MIFNFNVLALGGTRVGIWAKDGGAANLLDALYRRLTPRNRASIIGTLELVAAALDCLTVLQAGRRKKFGFTNALTCRRRWPRAQRPKNDSRAL